MSTRRGGIPGPESRTGLIRPVMSEAEFERRLNTSTSAAGAHVAASETPDTNASSESDPNTPGRTTSATAPSRSRSTRVKTSKPRRVQRMFALEEELDKKLWLYAIHLGKDRSEVINDLLRPVVASMVLYDSRDRKSTATRNAELDLAENRDLTELVLWHS